MSVFDLEVMTRELRRVESEIWILKVVLLRRKMPESDRVKVIRTSPEKKHPRERPRRYCIEKMLLLERNISRPYAIDTFLDFVLPLSAAATNVRKHAPNKRS